jgi:sortase A
MKASHERGASQARRALLMLLECALFALAIVCLGYYAWVTVEARLYQEFENRELDAILAVPPAPAIAGATPPAGAAAPAPTRVAAGSMLGRLEIPRLRVSTIVRAGSDARTLQLAVGHIPGTALPGDNGNIGLAGHRDTFFRRLREIRPGDEIRFVTRDGTFVYRVERTQIVEPRDVWVLDPTPAPALTLVTCYPFTYVGSAPQRFIVRAAGEVNTAAASGPSRTMESPAETRVLSGRPDIMAELNPKLVNTSAHDRRGLQSQGRRWKDNDRGQRLERPGKKRQVRAAGRPGGRHERVDLPRRAPERPRNLNRRRPAA